MCVYMSHIKWQKYQCYSLGLQMITLSIQNHIAFVFEVSSSWTAASSITVIALSLVEPVDSSYCLQCIFMERNSKAML